jgi:hypothetical protein
MVGHSPPIGKVEGEAEHRGVKGDDRPNQIHDPQMLWTARFVYHDPDSADQAARRRQYGKQVQPDGNHALSPLTDPLS